MSGSLLRSGALREFFALGAVGHPVYQSATQLRVAMRSQIGAEVADTFAIPKRNDSGDRIDWYAPSDGPVVPWSSATDEERAGALQALQEMRERVLAAGRRLQADADSERQVFGRLLQHVMTFPDDQHVYLVDGRPVLTFWGFRRHDAPAAADALGMLAAPASATLPVDAPPTTDQTPAARRWPWWLWPLLLLLLLIPLLFWYRSCSELPPLSGLPSTEPPALPSGDVPAQTYDPIDTRPLGVEGRPVDVIPGVDRGVPAGVSDGGPDVPPADAEDPVAPAAVEAPPSQQPEPRQETPPAEDTQQPPADQAQDEPPAPPAPEMPAADASDAQPPPLQIPADALEQGNVDFLNGRWNSNSGLIDETGRPVQLEYEFKQGQGSVSLRRSDGSVCRGSASASIAQQRLVISDSGQIRCPDGQFFEPSTVDCAVGQNGQAECDGRYATGGAFPVEIRQAE